MEARHACRTCDFWIYDMDGEYCAHPESFKQTVFGLGLNAMRSPDGPCGPEATLHKERSNVVRVKRT